MRGLLLAALLCSSLAAGPAAATETPKKVLRYAFRVAETGFDPARVQDLYSRMVTPHIFEGLVTYDPLARPVKLEPQLAESLPTPNEDFTVWTARIRPGIHFQDDPAFKATSGKGREVVAEDFVYSLKRFADPAVPSPSWSAVETWGIVGLTEARKKAVDGKQPFDYDAPIAGLKALDRYTLRIQLARPDPRFLQNLAPADLYGVVAREVVETYGDQIMAHPVGTGPFVLKEWRRASYIVLERNPTYRERFYDAEPNADDAEGQALLAKFKGRRLPMIDRVEIAIIEENQPRWLSFLNAEHDFIERVPEDFIDIAAPGGRLAPNLAKQGMRLYRQLNSEVFFTMFNMEDPVLGGLAPEKVALRRAISLGMDVGAEIRLVRRGQAIPAQSTFVPGTSGYDPDLVTENSLYDPARAKGLLDTYGYRDANGDGCRDLPGGGQLSLVMNTTPEAFQRQIEERFDKDMRRIGLCWDFKVAKWPEQLKAARAGRYQAWSVAQSSEKPDSISNLARLHGGQIGSNNLSRFRHPEVDRIYDQVKEMPDGPERQALFRRTALLGAAFMPIKFKGHRYLTDIARPQLIGYRRTRFVQNWWEFVDIDTALVPR